MLIVNKSLSYSFINTPFSNELFIPVYGHEKTPPDKPEICSKINNVFHYVVSGHGYFKFNGINYRLSSNDIFYIPADSDGFSYYPDKDNPWEYYWFDFIGSKSKELCENAKLTAENPVYHCKDPGILKEIRNLDNNDYSEFIDSCYSTACLLNVFKKLTMLRNPDTDTYHERSIDYIETVQNYINRNYPNPRLSLALIAKDMHMNPSYLSRIYKEKTGMVLSHYIISVRIMNAKRLLLETDLPVNEIAKEAGYSNTRYFCKQFKIFHGGTPTWYRNYFGKNIKYEELL